MAKFFNAKIVTTTVVLLYLLKSADASVCLSENPCLCQLDEYRKINLSPLTQKLGKKDFLEDDLEEDKFYFHGCEDGEFNSSDHKIINASNPFVKGSLIHIHVNSTIVNTTTLINTTVEVLGNSTNIEFVPIPNKKDSYQIVYRNGANVSANIHLICVTDGDSNLKISTKDSTPSLILYSPYACILADHPGLSTGSVLCILFFISLAVYFIGGAIVLRLVRGATGTELIPHVDFWRSLPGLVKDGCIFLFSGCNANAVSTSETYDRI